MNKVFYILILVTAMLMLSFTSLLASRNSDDIVTVTNSAYNNYIQDVIGNKLDTTNGRSISAKVTYIRVVASNANYWAASNLSYGLTNKNRLSIVQSDGITNEKILRTNMNRISLIQSDGVTNYSLLLTNNNRLSIIQSDGITNESLIRTNRNWLSQLKVNEISNYSLLVTNGNRLTIIQSDGVTNYSLLLTNNNRLTIIQSDGVSNESLLQQIKLTNYSLLLTNGNRLSIIQSDGLTNESLLRTNQSWLHTITDHIHNVSKVYPTMAAGAAIGSSGTVWTASNNYTNVIVGAGVITSIFDIHYISIEAISQNSVNELILYNMTTSTEIGRIRFVKTAIQEQVDNVMIMTLMIPANAKIGARMGSSVANTTATVSVFYHTY